MLSPARWNDSLFNWTFFPSTWSDSDTFRSRGASLSSRYVEHSHSFYIQKQSICCVAQFHISILLESEEVKEDKAPLLQQSAWFLWKAFANNLTDQCCPCQAREEAKWPRTKWRKMSPVINHRPAIHPSWTLLPVLVILIHCGKKQLLSEIWKILIEAW